jgi:hypothetical protein
MMGIGLVAGVFTGWPLTSCWRSRFSGFAIVYGGLGIVRGDNQARLICRGDSEITVAVLMPVAWHIGGLAGYL